MYCKNCGAQIPDDSAYCSKCGQKQFKSINEISEPVNESENNKNKGCLWWFCIITIAALLLAILISLIIGLNNLNQNNEPEPEKETISEQYEIEAGDIEIECIWNMNNSQLIAIITPRQNIATAEIKYTFYDKENKVLYQVNQNLADLPKDIQQIKVINFMEISNKKSEIGSVQYKLISGWATYTPK